MTKKDMARAIAEGTGIPQVQVMEVVQRVFDGITEALVAESGKSCYGSFSITRGRAVTRQSDLDGHLTLLDGASSAQPPAGGKRRNARARN